MDLTYQRTAEAVRKVYLGLSDQEIATYTQELNQIFQHLKKVKEAPTEGIEPTVHPVSLTNVFRADEVGRALEQEEALANAPLRKGAYFRTPKILDQE